MIYGEHLCADEVALVCNCGVTATVEVHDRFGGVVGWFCRRCAADERGKLRRAEKIAKATARKAKR